MRDQGRVNRFNDFYFNTDYLKLLQMRKMSRRQLPDHDLHIGVKNTEDDKNGIFTLKLPPPPPPLEIVEFRMISWQPYKEDNSQSQTQDYS